MSKNVSFVLMNSNVDGTATPDTFEIVIFQCR